MKAVWSARALAIAVLLAPPRASADVGPPDTSCTVAKRCEGQGVECRYVNSQPDAGELQCMADAESRGLELVCSRGGGTVGSNVYCPKGAAKPRSGCASAPAEGGVPGVAAIALVMIGLRRVRRGAARAGASPRARRA
ncbi:MAG: hypothetical protein KIS78_04690 [Labilithrix sp.]|nr:hypothetical protein [Labilithrix sp.]MCW5831736.1 hypothetical protein [Labilithrix sp.]